MAFPSKPPPGSPQANIAPPKALAAAKSKFMTPDQEPDVGDPGEGMETDPVESLSPQAQAVFQQYAESGQVPSMDDLLAEGLAEDEAMAILDILDSLGEGPVEPQDAPLDQRQGFPATV